MGAVSDMLRGFHKGDLHKSAEDRKKKRKEEEALSIRRAAKRAAKANDSLEVVLCATMEEVRNELAARGSRITAKKAFLKGQVKKRLMTSKQHGVEYPMSADWDQFRSTSTRKVAVTAKEKGTEAEYLFNLLDALMAHDATQPELRTFAPDKAVRSLPPHKREA